jgi:hypothetical protein
VRTEILAAEGISGQNGDAQLELEMRKKRAGVVTEHPQKRGAREVRTNVAISEVVSDDDAVVSDAGEVDGDDGSMIPTNILVQLYS